LGVVGIAGAAGIASLHTPAAGPHSNLLGDDPTVGDGVIDEDAESLPGLRTDHVDPHQPTTTAPELQTAPAEPAGEWSPNGAMPVGLGAALAELPVLHDTVAEPGAATSVSQTPSTTSSPSSALSSCSAMMGKSIAFSQVAARPVLPRKRPHKLAGDEQIIRDSC
jgi:hypothetical protein